MLESVYEMVVKYKSYLIFLLLLGKVVLILVCVCVCACARACVCVCVCVGVIFHC